MNSDIFDGLGKKLIKNIQTFLEKFKESQTNCKSYPS